ncbi:hypothetical protein CLV27_0648 [Phorcysia thermohydrogeniphila]|uniref:Uncharacterized protein n=1 Tax=Phorcysia thermohydrogeniphila TaxID=936138 RepID=A0A4R1GLI6_9BACT|nr:hypothetical protein CLV27_0648 [Phorcysia thermohydrogeniphila]
MIKIITEVLLVLSIIIFLLSFIAPEFVKPAKSKSS